MPTISGDCYGPVTPVSTSLEAMLVSSPDGLEWRRSHRCNGGACVEVARFGVAIMVRNSADPDGATLTVGLAEWQDFLSGARAGRFDLA